MRHDGALQAAVLPYSTPPGTGIMGMAKALGDLVAGKSRPRPRSVVARQWHGRPPETDSASAAEPNSASDLHVSSERVTGIEPA